MGVGEGLRYPQAMMSVVSSDHIVLSATPEYVQWLGRTADAVIGQSTRSWCQPQKWGAGTALFDERLRLNMPRVWERQVLRPDGTVANGNVTSFPLLTGSSFRAAICVYRVMPSRAVALPSKDRRAETAEFIADMARQMADMADARSMADLSYLLEIAARQAETINLESDQHRQ